MPAARLPARFAVLVAVVCVLLGPVAASAQTPAEASRVRILLLIDDSAPGASVNGFALDHSAVKKVFKEAFRALNLENRYTLDILDGKNALRSKVLAYYRNLKTEPDEVLVCYFSGHGGADPQDGHFLDLEDGTLKRSELRAAMLAKNTRLVVLITDCCADYNYGGRAGSTLDPKPKNDQALNIAKDAPKKLMPNAQSIRRDVPGETLRQLLFHHQGIVDITACQIGKQAFSSKNIGGYFTLSLVALLQAPPEAFGVDPANRLVSWSNFFVVLRRNTEEAAGRDHNTQTPVAFALGKK
jgi:hypothetical protein